MPVSLEILNLSGGESFWARHKFTGGIPVEWSSMTNLKELKMANCGLDGQCFNVESNHPCAQLMRTFRMLRGVCYLRARLLLNVPEIKACSLSCRRAHPARDHAVHVVAVARSLVQFPPRSVTSTRNLKRVLQSSRAHN